MHLSSSPPSVPQCLAMGSSDPTPPLRLGVLCPWSLPLRHAATQPTARPLALRVLNLLQKVARKLRIGFMAFFFFPVLFFPNVVVLTEQRSRQAYLT